jgi:hypothetical protein
LDIISSLPLETVAAYLGEGDLQEAPRQIARYVSRGLLCSLDLPGVKEDWEVQTASERERIAVHKKSTLRIRLIVDFAPKIEEPRSYLAKLAKWMHFLEERNVVSGKSPKSYPAALSILGGTDPFGRPLSVLAAATFGKGRMYTAIASAPQGEFGPTLALALGVVLGIAPL